VGHRRSPDDCPGVPLATSASSLQAATSPAQPRIGRRIGRRLRGQTGRPLPAPDRRPWAEIANEVREQVQAVIDTEREFRAPGDVAALFAGDIVPLRCHTPGASTLSGGNSRATPGPPAQYVWSCSEPLIVTDPPSWSRGFDRLRSLRRETPGHPLPWPCE
jgi:hypothetical protein